MWSAFVGRVSFERICKHQTLSCSRRRLDACAGHEGCSEPSLRPAGQPRALPSPHASPQLAFLWRTFLPLSFTCPLLFLGDRTEGFWALRRTERWPHSHPARAQRTLPGGHGPPAPSQQGPDLQRSGARVFICVDARPHARRGQAVRSGPCTRPLAGWHRSCWALPSVSLPVNAGSQSCPQDMHPQNEPCGVTARVASGSPAHRRQAGGQAQAS